MENLKNWIKRYVVEIVFFFSWLYIFYMMPHICDRMMEDASFMYDLENTWRYIFYQYTWLENVSGRIFSNLFSYLVDKTLISHAIVNSTMMLMIFNLIVKSFKFENKGYVKLILFSMFFLIPWSMQREVYLYATTLYISSALLLVTLFFVTNKIVMGENDKKHVNIGYFVSILSVAWLETLPLAGLGLLIGVIIYYVIHKKKMPCCVMHYTVIVSIGLLSNFLIARHASLGRLNVTNVSIFDFGIIYEFFQKYACILFFASLFIGLRIIKMKKGIVKSLGLSAWIGVASGCLFLEAFNIYKIVASDPVLTPLYEIEKTKIWKNFNNIYILDFFEKMGSYILILIPYVFICAVILLLVLLIINDLWSEKIYIISMGVCACVLYFTGLQNGMQERVLFLGIISLIIFVVSCLKTIEFERWWMKIIVFVVMGLCIVSMDTIFSVVINANDVATKREKIISEVIVLQAIGEWDYSQEVYLPEYDYQSVNSLIGEVRLNPSSEDIYYYILLKEYGLNEDTIIKFK